MSIYCADLAAAWGLDMYPGPHPADRCEVFQKRSPEQRMAKANKLQLCHICLRHAAEKECYAMAKAKYKEWASLNEVWTTTLCCTGP